MDPVDKKAEDNGFIPIALYRTVLFLEREDECICQVWCSELKECQKIRNYYMKGNLPPHKTVECL